LLLRKWRIGEERDEKQRIEEARLERERLEKKRSHRMPDPFIVYATLTCGHGTHRPRGDPPRIACPPVNARLTWPQQTSIHVTFSPKSTR
jgi:hypothetical protein